MRGKVIEIARTQIGIKEHKDGLNPQIEMYHRFSEVDNKKGADDSVNWCSSFVCYVMESAGLPSTNSKAARSWLKYGKETKTPQQGDIVVFWRVAKDGWQGHVGFFMGFTSTGNIKVLGGNQNDEVNITVYNKDKLLGFRAYE